MFLFLCLLAGGLIVGFVQKYILRIKEPDIEDLWVELEEHDWYKTLMKDEKMRNFLHFSKKDGLLTDPHYVRTIIDKEGHREGFVRYVKEKM